MQKILTSSAHGLVKSITTSFLRVTSVRLATLVSLILASIILAACGGGGSSGSSGASSPPTISGLDWSVAGGAILLDWNDFPGASNYTISRNSSSTGGDSLAATIIPNSNYTDIGVPFGNAYKYQISACNNLGCSANASLAVNYFAPAVPRNLNAVVNDGSIDLTWAASSWADNYKISRNALVLVAAHNTNAYTDRSVTTDRPYSYKVMACNRVTCSVDSTLAVDYFVTSAPAVPSGLSWSAIEENALSLRWDAAPTASSYTINRTGLQTTTTDSNYTDSGVVVNASYAYSVAACNTAGCSASINVTAEYFPIVSTFNIDDSGSDARGGNSSNEIELSRVISIPTAVVAGSTFLFSAAAADRGVSVFNLTTSGSLEHLFGLTDTANRLLDSLTSASTIEIAGTTYLFVTSALGSSAGVSVFSVAANGILTLVDSQANEFNINLNPDGLYLLDANSATTLVINGQTYLFVGKGNSREGDGVSIFSVADEGTLTYVDDVDDPTFQLTGTRGVTAATIGSVNYLFVVASIDGAMSVFSVADTTGNLSYVGSANQTNYPNAELFGVVDVTTAVIDDTTYLFVASLESDGVSVFSVAANGNLINVANIDDANDIAYQLDGAISVTTTKIAGTTYLFVASLNDDGVSVFSVDAAGSLSHVASVDDAYDADYELDGAVSVTTAEIAGNFYMLVAGSEDHGVSVFKLNLGGHAPVQ